MSVSCFKTSVESFFRGSFVGFFLDLFRTSSFFLFSIILVFSGSCFGFSTFGICALRREFEIHRIPEGGIASAWSGSLLAMCQRKTPREVVVWTVLSSGIGSLLHF